MLKPYFTRRALVAVFCGVFSTTGWTLDDKDGVEVNCDHYNQYGNPYFGDTHAHTTFSVDAFTQGTETTPEQAYLFAKGEEIGLHPFDVNGNPHSYAQLERPLDFAMVSDHAEFFGEYSICLDPTNPIYSDPTCDLLRQGGPLALVNWNIMLGVSPDNVGRFDFCGEDGTICTDEVPSVWRRMMDAAEEAYDRSSECEFTSFIGYEWTGAPTVVNSRGREVYNLHRNILFLNSLVPIAPLSYLDAGYPEDLWDYLQTECLDYVDRDFECDVLTIPHNSNLSQGAIFNQTDRDGNPYTKALAKRRAQFEPLLEVMQHKGQSECLRTPANNDELCDYEIVPWGHLGGNFINPTEPQPEGFGRYILKEGLAMKDDLGANAFQYGLIGSTDTHLGTPGLVEESAEYPGHGGAAPVIIEGISDLPQLNPGGLAVVWATQNSRAALFDAMRRKEAYATSGPRHIVRFHGSWDLPADVCTLPNRTEVAFNDAVPMGAELPLALAGQDAPQFLVSAIYDAGTAANPGTELQRIQIIKGYTDSNGDKQEKIYEVAGDPNNSASVDTNSCEVTGQGYTELCELWTDPDFDPDQNAFYYARIVENPSCRWTQKQCIAADPAINCAGTVPDEWAACCDSEIPKTVQERSWTSPIWYNVPPPPGGGC